MMNESFVVWLPQAVDVAPWTPIIIVVAWLWSSVDVVAVIPHGRVVTCCQWMTMASIVIHLVAMSLSLDTWWEQFSGRWGGCLLTWAGRKQPDSDNVVSCHCQTSACCVALTLPSLIWLVMWHCVILVVLVWAGVIMCGRWGLLVGQVSWTGIVDGVVEELGGSGQTLMVGVELFVIVKVVCWCEMHLFWECKHDLLSYIGKRLVATGLDQSFSVFPFFNKPCNWGLYCLPLIPARIQQNLGNSWNSRGINFGTGACQIDYTIPAECRMEFKFCQNGSRIHTDGMAPGTTGTESSMPKLSISKCQLSIWWSSTHQFLLPQPPPPPPPLMTPIHHCLLTTITSSSPSPLATTIHIHHPQPPQCKWHGNATSPSDQWLAMTTWQNPRGHVADSNVANDEWQHSHCLSSLS